MKLIGQDLDTTFIQPFSLKRPDGNELLFQLSPLPLGFQSSLRKRGVIPPIPPLKISRDSSGKPLRGSNGLVVTHSDNSDSKYLAEFELYHQRVAVLAIVESLKNDPAVSFETAVPPSHQATDGSWSNFADAIFIELEQAGFTAGDLISFCDEICKLSNMLNDQLQESQRNFSQTVYVNST